MDVLFENHVELTKEVFIEMNTVSNKKARLFFLVVAIIYFLLPIISTMLFGFDIGLFVLCAVFGIVFLIFCHQTPKVAGAKAYRQQLVINNHEPLVKTTSVFENHMEYYSKNGSRLTIYYDRITSIRKTAHLMVVIYEKEITFPIDMSGFTKGTPEAFEAFLLEKGVKVK